MNDEIRALRADIDIAHRALADHPVFAAIDTIEALRVFMAWHVFAVWDFMTLLKRLQRDLTTTTLPWTPPPHPEAARLVNEIVLGEETDIAPGGRHLSHYGLYLEAMAEVGADEAPVTRFVDLLKQGLDPARAIEAACLEAGPAAFVRATLATALRGSLPQVLGSFFHGRENVIPDMFRALLTRWRIDPETVPVMVFYLERHVELDSGEHGPAAAAMITEIVGDDAEAMVTLLRAAREAIEQRRRFWDALLIRLAAPSRAAAVA